MLYKTIITAYKRHTKMFKWKEKRVNQEVKREKQKETRKARAHRYYMKHRDKIRELKYRKYHNL